MDLKGLILPRNLAKQQAIVKILFAVHNPLSSLPSRYFSVPPPNQIYPPFPYHVHDWSPSSQTLAVCLMKLGANCVGSIIARVYLSLVYILPGGEHGHRVPWLHCPIYSGVITIKRKWSMDKAKSVTGMRERRKGWMEQNRYSTIPRYNGTIGS